MSVSLRQDYDAARIERECLGLKGREARIASAFVSLYCGQALDAVAKAADIMVGTLRRWIDAFNSGGLSEVFDVVSGGTRELRDELDGKILRSTASKVVKLPAGHDQESLRKAAADAENPMLKERLLALATLYETKSMAKATRTHHVSVTQLSSWRDLLGEGGTQAVVFKGKEDYRPTPEEIDVAARNATCDADRSLIRAAGAVFNGTEPRDAASKWNVPRLTLAAFVSKVTKGGAQALRLEPRTNDVRHSAKQLKEMWGGIRPTTAPDRGAFATIADGAPAHDVLSDAVAGDPLHFEKTKVPLNDETLLQNLVKLSSSRREPFLKTIRWLIINRLQQRPDFEQALASNGIPADTFQVWLDRARRIGVSAILSLTSTGPLPTITGLPKVHEVHEPRYPRRIHRQILGLIAYSNGASIKAGAAIADMRPGEFFQLASSCSAHGMSAFERARLGSRHDTVEGLKEWRNSQRGSFPLRVADLLIAFVSDDPNFGDLLETKGLELQTVEKWHELIKDGDATKLDILVAPVVALPFGHTPSDIRGMVPYLRSQSERRKAAALISLYEGASIIGAADASLLEEQDVLKIVTDLHRRGLATVLGFAKPVSVLPKSVITPASPSQSVAPRASIPSVEELPRKPDHSSSETQTDSHKPTLEPSALPAVRSEIGVGKALAGKGIPKQKQNRNTDRTVDERHKAAQPKMRESVRQAKPASDRNRLAKEVAENNKKKQQAAATNAKQKRLATTQQVAAAKADVGEPKEAVAKTSAKLATVKKAGMKKARPTDLAHINPSKRHAKPEIDEKPSTKIRTTAKAGTQPPKAKRQPTKSIHLRGDYNVPRIDEMLRSASSSTVVKLKMLRKAYEGCDPDEIGVALHLRPALVTNWIDVFNRDGLIGLMLASKRVTG